MTLIKEKENYFCDIFHKPTTEVHTLDETKKKSKIGDFILFLNDNDKESNKIGGVFCVVLSNAWYS